VDYKAIAMASTPAYSSWNMDRKEMETRACVPVRLERKRFNPAVQLPYGLSTEHIRGAMQDFLEFIGFINTALAAKRIQRLESFLMPANFSSMVGEFIGAALPRRCRTLVKNTYHNGHPDRLPAGQCENNACQHGIEGIEIKASRHVSGWQGHNAEDIWLMVFVFESNSPRDVALKRPAMPFRFIKVVGAKIEKSDWNFSGRSETSRRTITASVTRSGFEKMEANWIYRAATPSNSGE